jgi:beta-phosphoglucomutase family hydrolase
MNRIEIFKNTEAFIFDLDGTLADTMPLHLEAWEVAAKSLGINYQIDFIKSCAGMPSYRIIELLNAKYNLNIDINEFTSIKEKHFNEHFHSIKKIDAVCELVYQYYNQLPMAVGTGGKRTIAEETLRLLELDQYIPVLVSANDVEQHKPHPETFLKCAELIQVSPDKCQVFEDGELGIKAAKAANMMVTDVRPFY